MGSFLQSSCVHVFGLCWIFFLFIKDVTICCSVLRPHTSSSVQFPQISRDTLHTTLRYVGLQLTALWEWFRRERCMTRALFGNTLVSVCRQTIKTSCGATPRHFDYFLSHVESTIIIILCFTAVLQCSSDCCTCICRLHSCDPLCRTGFPML